MSIRGSYEAGFGARESTVGVSFARWQLGCLGCVRDTVAPVRPRGATTSGSQRLAALRWLGYSPGRRFRFWCRVHRRFSGHDGGAEMNRETLAADGNPDTPKIHRRELRDRGLLRRIVKFEEFGRHTG